MYKLLLCRRYLRTRFIALASIISVMLGVATMIVVNSVMAGFSHEMRTRSTASSPTRHREPLALRAPNPPVGDLDEIAAPVATHRGHDADGRSTGMLSFQIRGRADSRASHAHRH